MNQMEIFRATQAELNRRRAVIDENGREADMIRRELARRVGCAA